MLRHDPCQLDAVYRPQGRGLRTQLAVLQYAAALGIKHAYLPPIMRALSHPDDDNNRHNRHGYDEIEPIISPELGGEAELDRLCAYLESIGGIAVVDWVPNHKHDSHSALRHHPWAFDTYQLPGGSLRHSNFFGLGWLVKVCTHDPEALRVLEGFMLRLAEERGWMLRADHYDGWQDPHTVIAATRSRGIPVVAEKIVVDGEDFEPPEGVVGETGYRPKDYLMRLHVRQSGLEHLTDHWLRWVDEDPRFRNQVPGRSWAEVSQASRVEAAHAHFTPDMDRLIASIGRPDVTRDQVAQWAASLGAYRTYCWKGRPVSEQDCRLLAGSTYPAWFQDGIKAGQWPFWQPIMAGIFAKGNEDRGYYRWRPLPAIMEVGGTPGCGRLKPAQFHAKMVAWTRAHPFGWCDTDMHDSKQSLVVLSNSAAATIDPEGYTACLDQLRDLAMPYDREGRIGLHAQRVIFDTLLSIWPYPVDRLQAYFNKAFREASVYTSWWEPKYKPETPLQVPQDLEWEGRVFQFVQAICHDDNFTRVLGKLAQKLAVEGYEIALNQHLLKLLYPGTAVLYDGAEGPDNKWLVDPDCRRIRDLETLKKGLRRIKERQPITPDLRMQNLIYVALAARAAHPEHRMSPWEPVDVGGGLLGVKRGPLLGVISLSGFVEIRPPRGAEKAVNLLDGYRRQALYVLK
jgi:(1->4)-alpha-D-glucan 1-alpha-D-glucosylmutase